MFYLPSLVENVCSSIHCYRTVLEHDGTEEYKVRAARAAKLAMEIDDKGRSKPGLVDFDDTGTEEERYVDNDWCASCLPFRS